MPVSSLLMIDPTINYEIAGYKLLQCAHPHNVPTLTMCPPSQCAHSCNVPTLTMCPLLQCALLHTTFNQSQHNNIIQNLFTVFTHEVRTHAPIVILIVKINRVTLVCSYIIIVCTCKSVCLKLMIMMKQ